MNLNVESYDIPFSAEVLLQIEKIIRQENVFTFFDQREDPYQALLYRRQQAFHKTKTIALFDQNVLNDVIEPVKMGLVNDGKPCSERGRFGAALMAFLQSANILIEPSFAIHEKGGHALKDLQLFRCADNIDPVLYAKLALGKIDRLPIEALKILPPLEQHDFSKKITGRAILRIAMLKIANLELEVLKPKEKMAEFIRWSFETFCIARVPTVLACAFFSPGRKHPMILGLKSPDRQRALQGIENALWDVQLIDNWSKRIKEQKTKNNLLVLCSRDRAVQNTAKILCHAEATPDEIDRILSEYFVSHWGDNDGRILVSMLLENQRNLDDPSRLLNKDRSTKRLTQMDKELEAEIFNWNPFG